MSWDCWKRQCGINNNKFEKAEIIIDGDEDDVVLCLLTIESKKESIKKFVHGRCKTDL